MNIEFGKRYVVTSKISSHIGVVVTAMAPCKGKYDGYIWVQPDEDKAFKIRTDGLRPAILEDEIFNLSYAKLLKYCDYISAGKSRAEALNIVNGFDAVNEVPHVTWLMPHGKNGFMVCPVCGSHRPYEIIDNPDELHFWPAKYCINCGTRIFEPKAENV